MRKLAKMELSQHAKDFIDEAYLDGLLNLPTPTKDEVLSIVQKSLNKNSLNLEETATLLRAEGDVLAEVFEGARTLKRNVYGNRIVLFAPLYIGNDCVNNCDYCSFKKSNKSAVRRTLEGPEIQRQTECLEEQGHKRLILVYGEHPKYDADYIAETVRQVYSAKKGWGEIRRVNINAAPLDVQGFAKVKEAGIGTYQIFMETYRRSTYSHVHPANTRKGDYDWRLDGLNRAMEAGIDDLGIGALFGLDDWRFEVLALVAHALFLEKTFGVGPHTISFPRLQEANNVDLSGFPMVNDEDFKRVIATLRLAVPYTGLILTAREDAALRRELLAFGVSQIDAGSRIELGGYSEAGDAQVMEREQFKLGDIRSLDDIIYELILDGHLPSFCTACYRLGRTGEHFMEFAIPGFIKRYCGPNALLTVLEYLVDYASDRTLKAGMALIESELAEVEDEKLRQRIEKRMRQIREDGKRDLYF